jgi:hypothetical protein
MMATEVIATSGKWEITAHIFKLKYQKEEEYPFLPLSMTELEQVTSEH